MRLDPSDAKKFDALFDCHKDGLVAAAHDGPDVIWINLCSLYGFPRETWPSLREHVRATYPRRAKQKSQ